MASSFESKYNWDAGDFKESRGACVLSQHPSDFPFDFLDIAPLRLATCGHGSQALFDFLFETPHDRFVLFHAIWAAAEDEDILV